MFRACVACASAVLLLGWAGVVAQRPDAFPASRDHQAIQYATHPVTDRVSQLNRRIQDGAVRLAFEPSSGYLVSVLDALNIPRESQTLVFSKTSAQADQVEFKNPRALYFDDSVSVGWVRGTDTLEVAAEDPLQGMIFYTLAQKPAATPELKREVTACLLCHQTWDTMAVPGMVLMSTFPMSDDPNAYASGVFTDHRTPMALRWGGWFVTGRSVPTHHLGNVPVVQSAAHLAQPAPPPVLSSIDGQFDTSGFPTRFSDVVALLVLQHQAHMTNWLTRIGWEARLVEFQRTHPGAADAGTTDRVVELARAVVDYLLFIDEAPLGRRVEGSSGFAEKFAATGPFDHKGRSLRQFDLDGRLMRYPCSYLIYSDAFDALVPTARNAVYRRMWEILSGGDTDKRYAHLTRATRQAVVEILRDTKTNLPDYFQTTAIR